ncbi:hypothetical protein KM777_09090, partial [Vibrio splendidus]
KKKDIEGRLVASNDGVTVALEVTISYELKKECVAQELVNRIHNLRKDSGFEVTDRIHIQLQDEPAIAQTVAANADYIKAETLADTLEIVPTLSEGLEIAFDDITTFLTISKH